MNSRITRSLCFASAIALALPWTSIVRADDLTLVAYKVGTADSGVLLFDETPAEQAIPRLVPVVDYSGDIWKRPALTGDWGGLRNQLSEKGFRVDFSITQIYQRNVSGGLDNGCTY